LLLLLLFLILMNSILISNLCIESSFLQLWSMWQQATRSIHLHPVLLNKADGKRIVLEAAQKDTKVNSNLKMEQMNLKITIQVFAVPSCCLASIVSSIQGNAPTPEFRTTDPKTRN
jgi:hypothetical protein